MPSKLWNLEKQYMPIPCADVILEYSKARVLLWGATDSTLHEPIGSSWGRVGKGERLQAAAKRILAEYGLAAHDLFLVGVFPIRFPSRSDPTKVRADG
jgi:hypothetical protein